jgi:hypothetical protein
VLADVVTYLPAAVASLGFAGAVCKLPKWCKEWAEAGEAWLRLYGAYLDCKERRLETGTASRADPPPSPAAPR